MKFIFLDIDGVLNNSKTKTAGEGSVFLDETNVKNLKRIIEKTCAEIVLVSSWKEGWDKHEKSMQSGIANELDKAFASFGLSVYDKTEGGVFFGRGEGVKKYLAENNADGFVIIDDSASDYVENGLSDNWIRPCGEAGGLTPDLSDKAIAILNERN